jgi:hypothetical protein
MLTRESRLEAMSTEELLNRAKYVTPTDSFHHSSTMHKKNTGGELGLPRRVVLVVCFARQAGDPTVWGGGGGEMGNERGEQRESKEVRRRYAQFLEWLEREMDDLQPHSWLPAFFVLTPAALTPSAPSPLLSPVVQDYG